jgi:enoyl-CoA hydratase/carnithine racemase
MGLADHIGTAPELDAEVQRLAAAVSVGSETSIREFKRLIQGAAGRSRDQAAQAEAASSKTCVSDPDTQARVAKFLSRAR